MEGNFMKRFISLILALVICLSFSTLAIAECQEVAEEENGEELVISGDQTRWEETEWYYRITGDGLVQKRLWSLTYGYWLTDWITIGHV